MHCAAFPLPRSPCLRNGITAGGRDGSPSHAVSADLPMGSVDFGERASAPEPGKCIVHVNVNATKDKKCKVLFRS